MPDQHPEGNYSDLDQILHISLDTQETANQNLKLSRVTTFRSQVTDLQILQPRG